MEPGIEAWRPFSASNVRNFVTRETRSFYDFVAGRSPRAGPRGELRKGRAEEGLEGIGAEGMEALADVLGPRLQEDVGGPLRGALRARCRSDGFAFGLEGDEPAPLRGCAEDGERGLPCAA